MQQMIQLPQAVFTPAIPVLPRRPAAPRPQAPAPQAAPESLAEADPGYVYLSVSRAMPGFVQVSSARQDPHGLTWTLQTLSGVTRFQNVHTVPTTNCAAVMERFLQAATFNQIPHHSDFFKISLRFAKNILDLEAYAFRPAHEPLPRKKKSAGRLVAAIAASVVVLVALLPRPARQATPTAAAEPTVAAPAPKPLAIAQPAPARLAAPKPTPVM